MPSPLVIISVPVVLILKQPDLGDVVAGGSSAGLSALLMGRFALAFTSLGWLVLRRPRLGDVVFRMQREYQKRRGADFSLTRKATPSCAAGTFIQSKAAIGSGGVSARVVAGYAVALTFCPKATYRLHYRRTGADRIGLVGRLYCC